MTEDKMVGWGVGDGWGSLVCCSPWGHKESDTTGRLNNKIYTSIFVFNKVQVIISLMEMYLSKLWELVMNREA